MLTHEDPLATFTDDEFLQDLGSVFSLSPREAGLFAQSPLAQTQQQQIPYVLPIASVPPSGPTDLSLPSNAPTGLHLAPLEEMASVPSIVTDSSSIFLPPTFAGVKEEEKMKTKKRKLSEHSNDSANAAAIAAVTKETLESLNIDPNSKEGKKTKRRIRNRMSAQQHRDRKNAYIETMEGELRHRDAKIQLLKEALRQRIAENVFLREHVTPTICALADANYRSNIDITDQDNTDLQSLSRNSSARTTESEASSSPLYQPSSPLQSNVGLGEMGVFGRAFTFVSISCMMIVLMLNGENMNTSHMNLIQSDATAKIEFGPSSVVFEDSLSRRQLTPIVNNIEEKDIVVGFSESTKQIMPVYRQNNPMNRPQSAENGRASYSVLNITTTASKSSPRYLRGRFDPYLSSHNRSKASSIQPTRRALNIISNAQVHGIALAPAKSPYKLLPLQPARGYTWSSVVMTQGQVLLDPRFSLTPLLQSSQKFTNAESSTATTEHEELSFHHEETNAVVHSSHRTQAVASTVTDSYSKALAPTVQQPIKQSPQHHQSYDRLEDFGEPNATIKQLNSNSDDLLPVKTNILTVRMPTTSIRLGDSWSNSVGEVEAIMNKLNLTYPPENEDSAAGEDESGTDASPEDFAETNLSAGSIELQCIVIGAKHSY